MPVLIACERVRLPVSDPRAVLEAEFALSELSKISDSGVYKSLSLESIDSVEEEEDGLFHHNFIFELSIASPYFSSGKRSEKFSVIVMRHKVDNVKSIAIDKFPEMDEAAIESFWIAKVEEKRRQREEAFRRLGTLFVHCQC